MHRFCVQQQTALRTKSRERLKVVKVFQVHRGVDLNGVVFQLAEDVIQRGENRRQTIDTSALRKLFAVERVDRDF